jgi:hypothetical protein
MCVCVWTLTHSTHFNREDGGSIYDRNAGNTADIHTLQRTKSRTIINNEKTWNRRITIYLTVRLLQPSETKTVSTEPINTSLSMRHMANARLIVVT